MKTGLFWRINQLTALYILFFTFAPPLQIGNIYRAAAVGAAVIWLLTVLGLEHSFRSDVVRYTAFSIILVCALVALNAFIFGISRAVILNLQLIMVVIVGHIAFFYAQNDRGFCRFVIKLITLAICFFCITTILGVEANPYAARIANSEWLADRFKGNENVGLYGYVYMCVLIFPSLLYMRRTKFYATKFFSLVSLAAIILVLYMVLTSGYVIAIACTLFSFISLSYEKNSSPVKFMILILAAFIIALCYDVLLAKFFPFAYSIIGDNPVYGDKLHAFEVLVNDNTATGAVLGRFKNYQASLGNILRYPVTGAYILGEKVRGGGHSWILDNLGRYGLVLTLMLMNLYWRTPFKIAGLKSRDNPLYKTVILIAAIFGFLDPYAQEISIALFVFMPFILLEETDADGEAAIMDKQPSGEKLN